MSVAVLRANDPDRVGDYELTGRLGEGGQGTVFLGRHLQTGQQAAIKLLHAELSGDERAQARFVREVGVAQRVAPFCTAQVLEVGMIEDRPYIVSEYVPGPSLHRQVAENGPLTGGALQRVAVGIATALVAIHEAGVVHRDLKPANVLLGPAGARVIDFGISRALDATTQTGGLAGTPVYMAPEQARGEPPEPPMDIFAWAATIVYAASGMPPFGSDTLPAVINRIMNGEPELGALEGPLRDIAAACLNKDATRRPQASEVLMSLLGGRLTPAPANPPTTTSGAYPAGTSGAYPASAPAAAPVAQPQPQPLPPPFEREEVMSGILEAGRDLAAARTPDGTIPPGPHTLPPAAPEPRPSVYERAQQHYAPPPPPPQPVQQPVQQQPVQPHAPQPHAPQPHAMHEYAPHADAGRVTIDPARTRPPQYRRGRGRAVAWAVSAAVLAALLTGLVLLVPHLHLRSSNGATTGNDSTPTSTATATSGAGTSSDGTGDDTSEDTSTPSPTATQTEDTGGYGSTPTHTPTYRPSPTHSWSPTPTPTPTPTDPTTPTPTPTDTGSGSGSGGDSSGGGY
jgi:serine/threonine protein kinase